MNLSPGGYIHESLVRIDERFELNLLSRIDGALLEDGEQIYIRKVDGRLLWLRANVMRGGEPWGELTPALAKDRLSEKGGVIDDVSLEKLRDMLVEAERPKTYEDGWYQDIKGDLYQFDKAWLGAVPNNEQKKTLEYLGR